MAPPTPARIAVSVTSWRPNPSKTAAKTSINTAPSTNTAALRPRAANAARRDWRPGSIMAPAKWNPAPPQITTAVSSVVP